MRILIADDHALFRDALARLVRTLQPTARVDEAGSLAEAEARLGEEPACELLLLDLRMPDEAEGGGPPAAQPVARLHRAHPGVPIVVVTGSELPDEARRARAQGAVACLRKSLAPAAMQAALQRLLAGEELDAEPGGPPDPGAPRLTPRQHEVLQALVRGASNKQIAQQLQLSEGTVKLHVAAILLALGASNRTEAAARAHALGWG